MATDTSSSVAAPRQFKINRSPLNRHYDIHSSDGQHLFHVDQSSFTRNKPDLALHRGPDARAPVVAVSHMPRLSGDFKIGLGDPEQPGAVCWEDMTKENLMATEHRWAMTLAGDPGARKHLVWKRTRSVAVDGSSVSFMSPRNYKLLDAGTNEVVAVFTSDRGYKTCGVLQINATWGHDFDLMVFITCVSLYEKARRRAQRAAAAHGGGG